MIFINNKQLIKSKKMIYIFNNKKKYIKSKNK